MASLMRERSLAAPSLTLAALGPSLPQGGFFCNPSLTLAALGPSLPSRERSQNQTQLSLYREIRHRKGRELGSGGVSREPR
jgi:hypothetical protein